MKNLLYLAAFVSIATLICCKDGNDLVQDPDEVIEIPGHDEFGGIYPVKINNSNQIIGYYGGLAPEASTGLLDFGETAVGFVINADGSGFTDLTETGHLATWPHDINDQGLIVGEYLPEGTYESSFLPGYAFSKESTGENFKNLHPEWAWKSSATHITNSGQIVGTYSTTELGSVACIFQGGTAAALLDTVAMPYSELHAVNETFAIIYANDGEEYHYFSYRFDDETVTKLDINSKMADFSEFHDINEKHLAVGFYIDLSVSGLAIGWIYDLETDTLHTYEESNKQGDYDYLEYNFMGINESGTIVGWSGRDYSHGLTQLRAMAINADFIGFRDITPENSEIYSEMVSINDQGLALGTLGLPRKNNGVANKIMVLEFF